MNKILYQPFFLILFSLTLTTYEYHNSWIIHNDTPIVFVLVVITILTSLVFLGLKRLSNQRFAAFFLFLLLASTSLQTNAIYYIIAVIALIALLFVEEKKIYYLLNFVFLGFFITIAFNIENQSPQLTSSKIIKPLVIKHSTQKANEKPSIIHIVLDGYGGNDALKKHFDFDNHDLITALEKKGFVTTDALTPYNKTHYAISAILSGNYLAEQQLPIKRKKLYQTLNHHLYTLPIIKALKDEGYALFATNNGFLVHPKNEITSIGEDKANYTIFSLLIAKYFSFIPAPSFIYDYLNSRVTEAFNLDFAKVKFQTPFYLYMHILSPHPPFTLDENGNQSREYESRMGLMLDADERHHLKPKSQALYQKGYVQKLKYTNKALNQLVDNILKNVASPKIIIIHGDHGSRKTVSSIDPSIGSQQEAFSTLLAIYSDDKALIKSFKTPSFNLVNLFRIIFNHTFNQSLPLLANKHFYAIETDNETLMKEIKLNV